jgi:hypothetical protein
VAKYSEKKIPWIVSQARKAAKLLDAWNYIIRDEILDNIVQHVNQDILIQPNFSSDSDAKLAVKIDIKAFISLQCFAGALRNNNQSLKEL